MSKYIVFILFFCLSAQLSAQKIIEKSLSAKGINTIMIDGNSVFRIELEAIETNEIALKTRSEGEYGEHNLLAAKTKNDTLLVSSKLQPFYVDPNNKSTAHKVIATTLKLSVPKDLSVYIKSDIATTTLSGSYRGVTIELINGNSILNQFLGNAVINTIHGYIKIETNDAKIEVHTKNGKINNEDSFEKGNHNIKLNSIHGDIIIKKSK